MTHHINDGRHISDIVSRTACAKHSAAKGVACFAVEPGAQFNSSLLLGLCGKRVTKAGFNGKISHESMAQKSSAPRRKR